MSTAILGFGMGTVFATGLVWIEERVSGPKIAALLVIAGTVGPDVFPAVVGQFLEGYPDVLIYVQFFTVVICAVLFTLAWCLAKAFRIGQYNSIDDGVNVVKNYQQF